MRWPLPCSTRAATTWPDGSITIKGLDHPKRMFDLTDGLIRRGYSDADIAGILGGNAVRVLGTIWAA